MLSGIGMEGLSDEEIAELRHKLLLDRPIYVQYGHWAWNLLQGDWGKSSSTNYPVLMEIKIRLPVTLQLAFAGWIISLIVGLTTGVISAVHRNSALDTGATLISMFGVAMPSFWLGILLIYLFSVVLNWLPTAGFVSIFEDPVEGLRHLILPAIALGFMQAAVLMRQTRSGMLEVLNQDYIKVARAKGLTERTITWVHALKNASLPILTIMGLQLGRLIGGTVIIESIFGIPGLGRMALQSIFMRDYMALQGVVLLVASGVVIINLITDLLYTFLDPRIRYIRGA
ncbi:MAG: ABC transporter permease [Deltaproteobacteria bacterium]|nr:ABC transporter permease [Deltaproteobacteria bacterium]